jgi:hypothetical protein
MALGATRAVSSDRDDIRLRIEQCRDFDHQTGTDGEVW